MKTSKRKSVTTPGSSAQLKARGKAKTKAAGKGDIIDYIINYKRPVPKNSRQIQFGLKLIF